MSGGIIDGKRRRRENHRKNRCIRDEFVIRDEEELLEKWMNNIYFTSVSLDDLEKIRPLLNEDGKKIIERIEEGIEYYYDNISQRKGEPHRDKIVFKSEKEDEE